MSLLQRVRLDQLGAAVRLAKEVYARDGRVLLAAGIGLNEAHRRSLALHGVEEVWVDTRGEPAEEAESAVVQVRARLVDELKSAFAETALSFQSTSARPGIQLPTTGLSVSALKSVVAEAVRVVGAHPFAVRSMSGLRAVDEYTMLHSVEVAILTGLIGHGLGLTRSELEPLVLSALLHDVGKAGVPLEILNKPGALTRDEVEVMKQHTTLGWTTLRANPELPEEVAVVALQHHEWWRGGGYPLGLSGEQIHPYARICTVADVYDALTADRVYRAGMSSAQALELMVGSMSKAFEPKVLTTFISLIKGQRGSGSKIHSSSLLHT